MDNGKNIYDGKYIWDYRLTKNIGKNKFWTKSIGKDVGQCPECLSEIAPYKRLIRPLKIIHKS